LPERSAGNAGISAENSKAEPQNERQIDKKYFLF
jgi:hypothetical protein